MNFKKESAYNLSFYFSLRKTSFSSIALSRKSSAESSGKSKRVPQNEYSFILRHSLVEFVFLFHVYTTAPQFLRKRSKNSTVRAFFG